jgi:hypothetical protein
VERSWAEVAARAERRWDSRSLRCVARAMFSARADWRAWCEWDREGWIVWGAWTRAERRAGDWRRVWRSDLERVVRWAGSQVGPGSGIDCGSGEGWWECERDEGGSGGGRGEEVTVGVLMRLVSWLELAVGLGGGTGGVCRGEYIPRFVVEEEKKRCRRSWMCCVVRAE